MSLIFVGGWITKCTTKTKHCNVDDELVNFSDLHCSIKIRQFQFNLPPSIRSHVSYSNRCIPEDRNYRSGNRSGGDNKRNPLGYRSGDDSKRTPVQNSKRNHRWKLCDGDNYREVFSDKNIDKRPSLNGRHICTRWYIQGVCLK